MGKKTKKMNWPWARKAPPPGSPKTPGRNDPCVCGSKVKYKYCCGRPKQALAKPKPHEPARPKYAAEMQLVLAGNARIGAAEMDVKPVFGPILLNPEEIAAAAERAGVDPSKLEKLRGVINRCNDHVAREARDRNDAGVQSGDAAVAAVAQQEDAGVPESDQD